MALGLDDVTIGTWTSPAGGSGCTVVVPPPETVGSIAVRGQSAGTREAAALGPAATVQYVDAVVLAGGSAFGLAAADGVMRGLETRGRGHRVPRGVVPIVASAIIFDAAATRASIRPDAAAGRAALERATPVDPADGRIGAGAGATVAKVGGLGHRQPGGQGIEVLSDGPLVVAALVVNNAVGEVVGAHGQVVVASSAPSGSSRWPADPEALLRGFDPGQDPPDARQNTVVGCIVTNAMLGKAEVHRIADLGHDGIALALRPAHTSLDGDALFGLATGRVQATHDRVAELAVRAVAAAARRGPIAAAAASRPASSG